MNEEFEVIGRLHCVLTDAEGRVKQEWEQPNAIVAQGKTWAASRMAGISGNTEVPISHMAIGTGSASGTGLGASASRKMATAVLNGAAITFTTSFVQNEGVGTITEAGLFNADNNTTLRFSTAMNVTKASADTLTINWTVSLP